MKINLPRVLIALFFVLLFLAHASGLLSMPFVDRLEGDIYDWRLGATMQRSLDPDIVILDIDEKSLAEVGHWPWGRDKLANIINKLFDRYHVSVVGFDVVFAEKDQSSGLTTLEHLAQNELKDDAGFNQALSSLRAPLDYDKQFLDAVRNRPVVLGYFFTADVADARLASKTGKLPQPVFPAGNFRGRSVEFTHWTGYGANLPELQDATGLAGHFNPEIDSDGIVRRVPMVVEYDGAYYESLSLAMVRQLAGQSKLHAGFADDDNGWLRKSYAGMEWLDVPYHDRVFRVPVDRNVATLIPYRGPGNVNGGSFRYISMADVLKDRVKPEDLDHKIILVGTTALGLLDMRATPVSGAYPGVEVHANLISGMLHGTIKEQPAYTMGAEIVQIIFFGLLLAIAMPFLSALRAVVLYVVASMVAIGINLTAYTQGGIVLPLAASLIMMMAILFINMIYGYFVESRSKRELTGLFGSYVPPELVDEMARDPRAYSMEGSSKELTVMFSDVRDFTTISESLKPRELAEYINDYLTSMSLIIQQQRGTLDKYIGDAIMAFWGAPVADPQHAQRAVETALDMQTELANICVKFKSRGWPEMRIGIGISTGMMSVGDMGSKIRRAYTVMGDAVNLGARLESLTKHYGVGILVADPTRKAVSGIVFREIDRVRVKGKDESVAIFEPVGREGQVEKAVQEEIKLWAQTLKLYRTQHWDQAELQLLNLARMSPNNKLYAEYALRIMKLRAQPPGPNWDGVTVFTSK